MSLVNEALSFLVLLRVVVYSVISLLHTSSSCSSWVRLLPAIWSVQAVCPKVTLGSNTIESDIKNVKNLCIN